MATNVPLGHDIGAFVSPRLSLATVNTDAGTDENGASVDRLAAGLDAALSCVLIATIGTATGSPTAETHRFKIQHAIDDPATPGTPLVGDWGDYLDLDGNVQFVDVANADGATPTLGRLDVNLDRAKRHLRIVYDSANSSFTAGTTPTNDVSGILLMGGGSELAMTDA